MYSTFLLAFCLSLFTPSLQQSTASFKDILSSQKNLTSFNETLTKYYPELLTYIGQQTLANPITVLAPSNAALAKTIYYSIVGPAFANKDVPTIKAILSYHVVPGDITTKSLLPTFQYFPTMLTNSSYSNVTGGQRVGGVMQQGTEMIWTSGTSTRSPAVTTDISFQGGTIHIIDSLLVPPSSFPQTAELFSTAAEPYQLTSFLGAIYYNNANSNSSSPSLASQLNTTSDLTLFVPNNVAMESVKDAITSLSTNPDAFSSLLKYHAVVGKGGPWYSTKFTENGTTLETLNGDSLSITFSSNFYFINGAKLLNSDLLLDNGVMHVIDNVLSPDSSNKPDPTLATQIPALSTAADASASEAPFTTWLPNTINTNKPSATAVYSNGGGGSGGAATTSSTGDSSAETGPSKKSGGERIASVSAILSVISLFAIGLAMR